MAGASPEAVARLLDPGDPDVRARFAGVRDAWEACQHTGYGEAVRLIASLVYDLEEITPDGLEGVIARHAALRQPGERLRLLRDVAGLDHVQIDDFEWACQPDLAGPDFFLYDLSWANFCDGRLELPRAPRRDRDRRRRRSPICARPSSPSSRATARSRSR